MILSRARAGGYSSRISCGGGGGSELTVAYSGRPIGLYVSRGRERKGDDVHGREVGFSGDQRVMATRLPVIGGS